MSYKDFSRCACALDTPLVYYYITSTTASNILCASKKRTNVRSNTCTKLMVIMIILCVLSFLSFFFFLLSMHF